MNDFSPRALLGAEGQPEAKEGVAPRDRDATKGFGYQYVACNVHSRCDQLKGRLVAARAVQPPCKIAQFNHFPDGVTELAGELQRPALQTPRKVDATAPEFNRAQCCVPLPLPATIGQLAPTGEGSDQRPARESPTAWKRRPELPHDFPCQLDPSIHEPAVRAGRSRQRLEQPHLLLIEAKVQLGILGLLPNTRESLDKKAFFRVVATCSGGQVVHRRLTGGSAALRRKRREAV